MKLEQKEKINARLAKNEIELHELEETVKLLLNKLNLHVKIKKEVKEMPGVLGINGFYGGKDYIEYTKLIEDNEKQTPKKKISK